MASKERSRSTGQGLEAVENFKYLGAIISNERSKTEILSRILQTKAALSRLKIIRRIMKISPASKVKLIRTLILSTTFHFTCKSWTLAAELERRIQPLETSDHFQERPCDKRGSSQQNSECDWLHEDLLTMVKKRKLRRYGHISRTSGMKKTALQRTVKETRRTEDN